MSSFSSIVTQTYLDTSSRALLLRGNEYLKPINISERWTRIRIGLLISMTPDSTNSLLQGMLAIGLCTSTTENWGSATSRFLGATVGNYPSGSGVGSNWTFNSSPPNSFLSNSTQYCLSKIGTTFNPFSFNYTLRLPILDVNPRRGILILDITKGSPNYTIQMFTGIAANMALSYGMTDLYSALEQVAAAPSIGGNQFTSNSATGVPFSETTSVRLTTLNLYWNRWSFPLQISGIATYIVY